MGYVKSTKLNCLLHQYVIYNLEKQERIDSYVIDHDDGTKVDNRVENLKQVPVPHNAKNKAKVKNALLWCQ